jgi:hypothetical protein
MSLNWEKQIQVLNKRVMMWRSTVVRNRISSLKVATTVRDHLFPKLELGLQFAEISKETCNGWTKTIIHTVLENSGISALFARSINISAFCSLAGIPDIWRRAQTIRMTELYVALNTEHCDVGVTTRARYASLASLEGTQLTKAIATIQSKCLNNRKRWNRQAGILQYWKDRGLDMISNAQSPNPLNEPRTQMSAHIASHDPIHIRAFTDGSTDPKDPHPNSGIGMALFDEKGAEIWQGGAPIRADGNNYVAEVAAAALVLDAAPARSRFTCIWTRLPPWRQFKRERSQNGETFAHPRGTGSTWPRQQ